MSNFRYGDGIVCGDIEDREGLMAALFHTQNGVHNVRNMDVMLALPSIAKDAQQTRIFPQFADKVEPHAMCLPRPHNIGKAESTCSHSKHGTVSRDHGFPRQLAGAVSRDRKPGTLLLT